MNIGRRTLIKSIFIAGAAYATWDFWKNDRLAAIQSHQWQAEYGQIFAQLAPVVVGRTFSKEEQTKIAEVIPQLVMTLPLQAQKDLTRLLQLLSQAPIYRFLGISSWSNPQPDAMQNFLKAWQQSNFAVWRNAYQGLSRLCLIAWYGQKQANIEITYTLPSIIQEYIHP